MTSAAAHGAGPGGGGNQRGSRLSGGGVSYAATDAARGVWRSTDGGATWAQVLANVNFSGNDDLRWQGECLAITPGSRDQEIFAISRKNGLWRSTDGRRRAAHGASRTAPSSMA